MPNTNITLNITEDHAKPTTRRFNNPFIASDCSPDVFITAMWEDDENIVLKAALDYLTGIPESHREVVVLHCIALSLVEAMGKHKSGMGMLMAAKAGLMTLDEVKKVWGDSLTEARKDFIQREANGTLPPPKVSGNPFTPEGGAQ